MNQTGIDESQKGQRIDNLPTTGTLTGAYDIDYAGCWWEVLADEPEGSNPTFWVIGEYPEGKEV